MEDFSDINDKPAEKLTGMTCTTGIPGKTDLTDFTLLVPLRIDSPERKENKDTLIKYTYLHFMTNFIVIESDSAPKFNIEVNPEGYYYEFVENTDEVFHRTNCINKLISFSDSPYVAVLDTDVIAPPEQIINTVNRLRSNEAELCLPNGGRFYSCDKVSCELFKKLLNIEILLKREPVLKLIHGYHSVGGAFFVTKQKYLHAGGENENFYG